MLKVYNTLSRKKEIFKPLKKKEVKMYICGPTVYDYAHIGNLSSFLLADLLKRYLLFKGYKVLDVINITDIDDKTIKHSQINKQSLKKYTEFYTKAFLDDLKKLNILMPKTICRATDYIDEMCRLIKILLNKGYAYKAEDNSVYFKISKFKNYGKLSNLKNRELKIGASNRINLDEYNKKEISDFVLWKAWQKKDGPNFWQSPFGKGRPGWHIECSAMSMKNLGPSLDIHTGGEDLVFPHHENEIAQSEAYTDKPFVKYWIHRRHINVDNEKMAKSKKNFYTLKNLEEKSYNPLLFRLLVLNSHYRSKMNFTFKGLEQAEKNLERINEFVDKLKTKSEKRKTTCLALASARRATKNLELSNFEKQFEQVMDDDLNTPKALAVLFNLINKVNSLIDKNLLSNAQGKDILNFLKKVDKVFGFIFFQKPKKKISKEILELIKEREKYRQQKNWQKADDLREKLKKMGYLIKDTKA